MSRKILDGFEVGQIPRGGLQVFGSGSILPYSIDFSTLVDGAIPSVFTGSTGSISGGKLVITPTESNDRIVNGTMELDANWSSFSSPTTNARSNEQAHSGTYSRKIVATGGDKGAQQAITGIVANNWYVRRGWVYVSTGRAQFGDGGYNIIFPANSTWRQFVHSVFLTGNHSIYIVDKDIGESIFYFDDISEVRMSDLFVLRDYRQSDVVVKAETNAAEFSRAGVVVNADVLASPTNYVTGTLDISFSGGVTSVTAKLDKVVAGAKTNLISAAVTYVAGYSVEVRKSGTTYQLYYNGQKIGTDKTISDNVGNTIHGTFSTYVENSFNKFSCRSTANRYSVVYLGGSITEGRNASAATCFAGLTTAWLPANYFNRDFTQANSGVPSTDTIAALANFETLVTQYNPDMIVLDWVNNSVEGYKSHDEALIRQIRTDFPNAQLIFVAFPKVADKTTDITVDLQNAVKQNWVALCNHYAIQFVDYTTEIFALVTAGTNHMSDFFTNDNIHPSPYGHAFAHVLLRARLTESFLAGDQWDGVMPDWLFGPP